MALSRARERLLRRIATRRGREAEAVVLIEGPRAVHTAVEFGADVIFAVRDPAATGSPAEAAVAAELDARGIETHVDAGVFRELSDTGAPQGVLAVAREPRQAWPPVQASERRRTAGAGSEGAGSEAVTRPADSDHPEHLLILDRVQDPGNVGTLIRTAAALDVDRVVVLPGTADPWGAKVVRASAGTVFGVPVHAVTWDQCARWLDETRTPLLVADARGEDARGGAWDAGWALLLANEAAGPSPEALARAEAVVSIPLARGVESLNVGAAGAILMWLLGRTNPMSGPSASEARSNQGDRS